MVNVVPDCDTPQLTFEYVIVAVEVTSFVPCITFTTVVFPVRLVIVPLESAGKTAE